jgi:phage gp36-like protein
MYCSVKDIEDYLSPSVAAQLSNDTNSNVVNKTLIQQYIDNATDFINGYLRGRYELPLQNTHSILNELCRRLVKYNLYDRRSKLDENLKELYNDAKLILKDIQGGKHTLDESDTVNEARPVKILTSIRKVLFGEDLLDNY